MEESYWEINTELINNISPEKLEELCQGVTTPEEVATFLGKSREPILEGALINVHHGLACEMVPGKPHQILITDHQLWHDYIDYFAGSKPNQTKSRVNRNKSFSSRWFKMPPGRKPKSFIIETYPARRKDVERKLAIVRSKVGDKNSPKMIKIGETFKTFTPPNPSQLLILLAHRKICMEKSVPSPPAASSSNSYQDISPCSKKRRRSVTDSLMGLEAEDEEYESSNSDSLVHDKKKRRKTEMESLRCIDYENSDDDLERATFLLTYLRSSCL